LLLGPTELLVLLCLGIMLLLLLDGIDNDDDSSARCSM
jgi:hypothetical protein